MKIIYKSFNQLDYLAKCRLIVNVVQENIVIGKRYKCKTNLNLNSLGVKSNTNNHSKYVISCTY